MTKQFGPGDMLSALQAGQLVGYNRRTIISWIQSGWLKAAKGPGKRGRYRIRYEDLMEVAHRPYEPRSDSGGPV
jgi:excisionase family DNA binding protein